MAKRVVIAFLMSTVMFLVGYGVTTFFFPAPWYAATLFWVGGILACCRTTLIVPIED